MTASDHSTMVFHLTQQQRRRHRRGVASLAVLVWALGLVRLIATGRVTGIIDAVPLAVLALVLGLAAVVVGRVHPVVVLAADVVVVRWGPRLRELPWSAVTGVEMRERGQARRVVLEHDGGRTVLPVPLTGGSLLSVGADPALDHKVDLIRQWWQGHASP